MFPGLEAGGGRMAADAVRQVSGIGKEAAPHRPGAMVALSVVAIVFLAQGWLAQL